jgi:hypothetical protein
VCPVRSTDLAADKIEYDVTDPVRGKRLHFHIGCHLAWQRECALRLRESPSPSMKRYGRRRPEGRALRAIPPIADTKADTKIFFLYSAVCEKCLFSSGRSAEI